MGDMVWYGPGGVGTAHSRREYLTHFLKPLHAGFSNISLQLDLLVCEGKYCGAHFYLHASHTGRWLGENATGRRIRICCGAHAHLEGGKIVEGWLIIDVARAFTDMGVDLYGPPQNRPVDGWCLGAPVAGDTRQLFFPNILIHMQVLRRRSAGPRMAVSMPYLPFHCCRRFYIPRKSKCAVHTTQFAQPLRSLLEFSTPHLRCTAAADGASSCHH